MDKFDVQSRLQISEVHRWTQEYVKTMKSHKRRKESFVQLTENDVRMAVADMLLRLENMARVDA